MNIKKRLLETSVVDDNDYLSKYIELIESNLNTKHISFKTQKHHIIPKCYYKLVNKQCDDSKENTVYLLYKDHVLAHYYLALCSKDNEFKYNNICALKYCLNHRDYKKQDFYKDERQLIEKLDCLQELYEESKIVGSMKSSLKQKGKTRKNKGTKHINKDGVYKMVSQEDLEGYLSQGWKLGARPLSIKHRKALLNANLGKPRSEEVKKKLHDKLSGRKISQERKDKISIESRDRVWINNGKINLFIKEKSLNDYLILGYIRGRLPYNNENVIKANQSKDKKVMCIETCIIYDSIADACRQTNIKAISKCCKGYRKTAGGYHWKYVDSCETN